MGQVKRLVMSTRRPENFSVRERDGIMASTRGLFFCLLFASEPHFSAADRKIHCTRILNKASVFLQVTWTSIKLYFLSYEINYTCLHL